MHLQARQHPARVARMPHLGVVGSRTSSRHDVGTNYAYARKRSLCQASVWSQSGWQIRPTVAGFARQAGAHHQRVTIGMLRLYNSVSDDIVLGSYAFLDARRIPPPTFQHTSSSPGTASRPVWPWACC